MKTVKIILTSLLTVGLAAPMIQTSANTNLKEKYRRPELKVPVDNKLNAQRVNLGKMLFFDPRMSGSNWISCATCHNPSLGWSDGLPKARGTKQKELGRATPTILNTAFNRMQMWDGRLRTLEQQALGPIESPDEMNQNLDELVEELKAVKEYEQLFFEAYPGQGITKKTIAKAIASFERTIVATQAPFDR